MIAGALSEIVRVGNTRSRAITAENRRGERGAGGAAASALGPGRKGSPKIALAAGETTVLAEIAGTGVVRHIWITVADRTAAGGEFVLRDLVLRAYWDGEETPSVEVPLGDFFCNGFARRTQVISIPIVVAPNGGMNCYFPMPFRTGVRLTVTSEHSADIESFFYQIDYSLEDELPPDVGYFHAQWRRQALTVRGRDHVILSDVTGPGTYVGTYIALSCIERYWWGEGEMKFFIDGDTVLPTICGTGLEDYVGGAWGFHTTPEPGVEPQVLTYNAPYSGYDRHSPPDKPGRPPYSQPITPEHGMYRWHLPDPITFAEDLRVTLQQIGHDGHRIFERQDDISTVAYWYQLPRVTSYPTLPAAGERRPR